MTAQPKVPLNIAISPKDKKEFNVWCAKQETNPSAHLRWYIHKLLTDAQFRKQIEHLFIQNSI